VPCIVLRGKVRDGVVQLRTGEGVVRGKVVLREEPEGGPDIAEVAASLILPGQLRHRVSHATRSKIETRDTPGEDDGEPDSVNVRSVLGHARSLWCGDRRLLDGGLARKGEGACRSIRMDLTLLVRGQGALMTTDAAVFYMYLMVVSVLGELAILSLQLIAYQRSGHKSLLLLAASTAVALIQVIVGLPLLHLGAMSKFLSAMSQPAGMAVFFTLQFLLALPGVAWLFNEFVRLTRLERSLSASS
jgi:hypothetical protein